MLCCWQQHKPLLHAALFLILLCSLSKIIFYVYNYAHFSVHAGGEAVAHAYWQLASWSLLYDGITMLFINLPILLLISVPGFFRFSFLRRLLLLIFYTANVLMLLLNVMDIFYYPFYHQRANTDLLFVLDNPVQKFFHLPLHIIIGAILITVITGIVTGLILRKSYLAYKKQRPSLLPVILLPVLAAAYFISAPFRKILLPAYPLVYINSTELQLVQNSLHTFIYSLKAGNAANVPKKYFSTAVCDALMPLKKSVTGNNIHAVPKNIVLFIMESVPAEFFDSSSKYKPALPFFDTLLKKSTLYSNAYSYAYESNKGIVSILAGIPTLTDVPLYHSAYSNLEVTHIGTLLQSKGYHSLFTIGDNFDAFGFAKCISWLGFNNYYCKTDIPGYAGMEEHTMGLHDEYVLNFMKDKINALTSPFFAVNYNISTHYPNDLPAGFTKKFPANYTAAMKSMLYYDHCLGQFFSSVKNKEWFSNTLFIFCSDHWALPDHNSIEYTNLSGFKIPIIVYDPSSPQHKRDSTLVSQFDIAGTIAAAAGISDTIISYGNNLLQPVNEKDNQYIFSRVSSSLYQVTDTSFVLGYNLHMDKPVYLYAYKKDAALKHNLLNTNDHKKKREELTRKIQAFFQKAGMQYFNEPFR